LKIALRVGQFLKSIMELTDSMGVASTV